MYTDYKIILDGAQPYDLRPMMLRIVRECNLPLAIGDATGPTRKKGEDTALRAYKRDWMRAKREGKRG